MQIDKLNERLGKDGKLPVNRQGTTTMVRNTRITREGVLVVVITV